MTQKFDEETLLWLEEERPEGGASRPNKKIAAIAGGGIASTAIIGKAMKPVAKKLSKKTGIPVNQIHAMLTVAAPIVVSAVSAAVAKRKHAAGQAKTVPGEIIQEDRPKEAHGLLHGHSRHRH